MQIWWCALVLLPLAWGTVTVALFVIGGLLEIAVPMLAERAGLKAWRLHHIMERYGLLIIIVLGESLLSTSSAIRAAVETQPFDLGLAEFSLTALVITFSMWWFYFTRDEHLQSRELARTFAGATVMSRSSPAPPQRVRGSPCCSTS